MTTAVKTMAHPAGPRTPRQESQLHGCRAAFFRHKLAMISTVLLILIFVASLLAPLITTFPRDAVDVSTPDGPRLPGTSRSDGRMHILGIDHLGRDLFTRVLYRAACRCPSLFWWCCSARPSARMLGALAGFYGGRLDMILSRINEFMLTIPQLPILLIISAIC